MQWQEFAPTFIVDITEVYKQRVDSIKAHKSQFYEAGPKEPQTLLSQQSSLDFVETRAKNFGYKIGAKYGEPFYSLQPSGERELVELKAFNGHIPRSRIMLHAW